MSTSQLTTTNLSHPVQCGLTHARAWVNTRVLNRGSLADSVDAVMAALMSMLQVHPRRRRLGLPHQTRQARVAAAALMQRCGIATLEPQYRAAIVEAVVNRQLTLDQVRKFLVAGTV